MSRGEQPVAVRWNRGVETALILLLVAALLGAGLFVWKRKSDRAACILNIRNVQQAVRAYQGTRQVIEGSPMDWTKIMGPGGLLRRTYCPCGGIYRFKDRMPAVGVLALECSLGGEPHKHVPERYSDW